MRQWSQAVKCNDMPLCADVGGRGREWSMGWSGRGRRGEGETLRAGISVRIMVRGEGDGRWLVLGFGERVRARGRDGESGKAR